MLPCILITFIVTSSVHFTSTSALSFHPMYTTNAILQRDTTLLLRGSADSSTDTITVFFDSHELGHAQITPPLNSTQSFTNCSTPRWTYEFQTGPADETQHEITIVSSETGQRVTVSNLVFGDIILCHGQSNALMNVISTSDPDKPSDTDVDLVRILQVGNGEVIHEMCPREASERINWKISAADYVSAVCYFTAHRMQQWNPKVPVGLVVPAVSGQCLSCFLEGDCKMNTRILRETKVAGVVWYQGESDAMLRTPSSVYSDNLTRLFEHQFRTYMKSYRSEKDLPIVLVQLPAMAPIGYEPIETYWRAIRESQQEVAERVSSVFLIQSEADVQREDLHSCVGKARIGQQAGNVFNRFYSINSSSGSSDYGHN